MKRSPLTDRQRHKKPFTIPGEAQFEPRIRELLRAWPCMPATVIAERIGWDRGITVLKDRLGQLRPTYLPADPASRTTYAAGEVGAIYGSRRRAAGRIRAGPHCQAVSGVDKGYRVCPLAIGDAGSFAERPGFVRRLVAADRNTRRRAAAFGVGRGGRDRKTPSRRVGAHPGVPKRAITVGTDVVAEYRNLTGGLGFRGTATRADFQTAYNHVSKAMKGASKVAGTLTLDIMVAAFVTVESPEFAQVHKVIKDLQIQDADLTAEVNK